MPPRPWLIDSAGSAALISAGLVFATGVATLILVQLGPLSLQMVQHLALMNVVAPIIATLLAPQWRARASGLLWIAALMQLFLLWAWHTPALQQEAATSFGLQVVWLLLLGASAVLFWAALLGANATGRWGALVTLMLTGKLACLLGALLVFAPNDLYGLPGLVLVFCTTGPSTLADQQLAGLLMVTACPLSYLVAGVVVAAQMFLRLERDSSADGRFAVR